MKLNPLSLSLGLVLLAGSQAPANAADWNYGAGSIKDSGYDSAAIAVPAPTPAANYAAEYYFRADAGIGFGDKPSASERGLSYGYDRDDGTFSVPSQWIHNDFETFVTLGVGVGAYWRSGFRGDLTAETRSQGKVKFNGDYAYDGTNSVGDAIKVKGETRDETTLRGGIFLANGYYDFQRVSSTGLRPYVGAGLGFAWNELKRNHFTDESFCYVDDSVPPTNRATCDTNYYRARQHYQRQDKTHSFTLAAQATVGTTYQISNNMSLDMNYRFLYIGGTDTGFGIEGTQFGGDSKISIGDTFEHQLRAGVRYDIN